MPKCAARLRLLARAACKEQGSMGNSQAQLPFPTKQKSFFENSQKYMTDNTKSWCYWNAYLRMPNEPGDQRLQGQ